MKKRVLFFIILITFVIEMLVTLFFLNQNAFYKNDSVKINELVKGIEYNYPNDDNYPKYYNYIILDEYENVIYKRNDNISMSLNEAYKNKDTIVDLNINNKIYKLIIDNDFNIVMSHNRKAYLSLITIISIIQLLAFIIYYIYNYIYIIRPFKKMKEFANRVSSGNLDIPLKMDKNNNFGAFTESFDIMRHEIKTARKREKEAIEAKKELVAKLSHDIKSPIASIKSSSELGLELTKDDKVSKQFNNINQKSDQINTLITNLFNSTLEEMEKLEINPTRISSNVVKELIQNADYQNKSNKFNIDKCEVYADLLRLQQVFDNIYFNSYKYADTKIEVKSKIEEDYLVIRIKDFGDSIKDEEMPLLLEKFKRGSNTKNKDGVGLGLYISKEFMNQMNGDLEIENDNPGFVVIIKLRII